MPAQEISTYNIYRTSDVTPTQGKRPAFAPSQLVAPSPLRCMHSLATALAAMMPLEGTTMVLSSSTSPKSATRLLTLEAVLGSRSIRMALYQPTTGQQMSLTPTAESKLLPSQLILLLVNIFSVRRLLRSTLLVRSSSHSLVRLDYHSSDELAYAIWEYRQCWWCSVLCFLLSTQHYWRWKCDPCWCLFPRRVLRDRPWYPIQLIRILHFIPHSWPSCKPPSPPLPLKTTNTPQVYSS